MFFFFLFNIEKVFFQLHFECSAVSGCWGVLSEMAEL